MSLTRETPELRAQFGPGALVGGLALVGTRVADFTIAAESAAVVLRMQDDDWFDVVDDHFDLARAVFAHMAGEREQLMRLLAVRGGRAV